MHWIRALNALVILSTSSAADDALPNAKLVPDFQAVPMPGGGISLQAGGRELTRYVAGVGQARPYWFPLAHSSGRSLTRLGHPHDPDSHRHHNSVWISHRLIDGVNFWEDHRNPTGPIIAPDRVEKLWDQPDACGAAVVNIWMSASKAGEAPRPMLHERRRFEARRAEGADPLAAWWLVVDLELSAPADQPVVIGQSPFGILGVRVAKSIGVNDGGGRILNSEGAVDEAAVFRKPARWVDYSGPLTPTETGGITLMDHPSNPGHPTPCHVRNDGWMGPCLTLDRALTVEPGAPLRLRYALFCHDRTLDRSALETRWAEFLRLPLPALEKR